MKVWPFQFQAGDVVDTGVWGLARLVREMDPDENVWLVHYLALDIEESYLFEEKVYDLVEVMA